MTHEEVLRYRSAIQELAKRYHVQNPRLFGSVVKGDTNRDSDIDFLVDATSDTTLFDIGGLRHALSQLLKTSVDVVTPEDLGENFRKAVVANAKRI